MNYASAYTHNTCGVNDMEEKKKQKIDTVPEIYMSGTDNVSSLTSVSPDGQDESTTTVIRGAEDAK